jgi:hypothetical protein
MPLKNVRHENKNSNDFLKTLTGFWVLILGPL